MAATLVLRLTGGSSNSDPNASLGGVMSSNAVSATALNNIFDNVSSAEATSGDTGEYRAVDLYNSGDATAGSVKIWLGTETTSTYTTIHIGHDATNDPHAAATSLETIGGEDTAPASPTITFAARPSGSELTLPDIPASQACRIWLKRIVTANAPNLNPDTGTLNWSYA